MDEKLTKIAKNFQTFLHIEMNEAATPKEEKRYVVTLEFYMWDKDDKGVKKQAEKLDHDMDMQEDNSAKVLSIYEQVPGTIGNRKLFDKS